MGEAVDITIGIKVHYSRDQGTRVGDGRGRRTVVRSEETFDLMVQQ